MFIKHRPQITPLLEQWRIAMMAQSLRPRTIADRIRVVAALAEEAGVPPEDLTLEHVTVWLAAKRTAITRWSYFTSVKAFFRWLVVTGRRATNPLENVPAPRRPTYDPRPVDQELIDRVLSQPLYFRSRMMILLAAYAGLRVHEIAKIHGRDYDPDTGSLTVEGKGGHVAVIPLHSALQICAKRMPADDWWFPSPVRQGHVTSRAVGSTISRCFARYGVRMTAHQLRHSFGTALVESGTDIRVAQTLMRHQSIASTAIYVRVSPHQQRQALDRLPQPKGPLS